MRWDAAPRRPGTPSSFLPHLMCLQILLSSHLMCRCLFASFRGHWANPTFSFSLRPTTATAMATARGTRPVMRSFAASQCCKQPPFLKNFLPFSSLRFSTLLILMVCCVILCNMQQLTEDKLPQEVRVLLDDAVVATSSSSTTTTTPASLTWAPPRSTTTVETSSSTTSTRGRRSELLLVSGMELLL